MNPRKVEVVCIDAVYLLKTLKDGKALLATAPRIRFVRDLHKVWPESHQYLDCDGHAHSQAYTLLRPALTPPHP